MYYVIYEFEVNSHNQTEFTKIWHQLTIEIKKTNGGLGSRLHKDINRPNSLIAYAQWPDKETWENKGAISTPEQNILREKMLALCNGVSVVNQLEMVDDLLE